MMPSARFTVHYYKVGNMWVPEMKCYWQTKFYHLAQINHFFRLNDETDSGSE